MTVNKSNSQTDYNNPCGSENKLTKEIFMRHLHIIDVSATLHGGIRGHFKDNNHLGFPTGGIFNTLKLLTGKNIDLSQDRFVFCFDRRTRKDIEGYKANRKGRWTPEMFYQAKLLEELVKNCNFPYVVQEDREADECIYAVVRKYHDDFQHIYIHGTDRDLAGCVDKKVSLISTSSHVSDITYHNFEDVIKDEEVPFNTILLYKICRKDTSDCLHPIIEPSDWTDLLYRLRMCNFPLDQLNTEKAIRFVIERYNCAEFTRHQLWERYDVVMPRPVEVDLDFDAPFDLNAVDLYSSLLSLTQFSQKMGVKASMTISPLWRRRIDNLASEINMQTKKFVNKKLQFRKEEPDFMFLDGIEYLPQE
jgi:hypothetical protein